MLVVARTRRVEEVARRTEGLAMFMIDIDRAGGGEKTPESRIRAFSDYFTGARYVDGYGLTKTCGGDTLMEAGYELSRIGSTGRATAHVQLRIRDEAGQDMPPDADGEVCLRGPKVMPGYRNAPQKNAESFFADGYFRTGDVGHVDADGFLCLTDRRKDMIISAARTSPRSKSSVSSTNCHGSPSAP